MFNFNNLLLGLAVSLPCEEKDCLKIKKLYSGKREIDIRTSTIETKAHSYIKSRYPYDLSSARMFLYFNQEYKNSQNNKRIGLCQNSTELMSVLSYKKNGQRKKILIEQLKLIKNLNIYREKLLSNGETQLKKIPIFNDLVLWDEGKEAYIELSDKFLDKFCRRSCHTCNVNFNVLSKPRSMKLYALLIDIFSRLENQESYKVELIEDLFGGKGFKDKYQYAKQLVDLFKKDIVPLHPEFEDKFRYNKGHLVFDPIYH